MQDRLDTESQLSELLGLPTAGATRTVPVELVETILAGFERHKRQLRQANDQLIQAASHAQQQRALSELALHRQTEFLSFLAHELRDPLAPLGRWKLPVVSDPTSFCSTSAYPALATLR